MASKYPILIQGPTSAGKTSMIEYLAKRTGHKFVRINNHEHTDIQEYIGSYKSNAEGKLEFVEVHFSICFYLFVIILELRVFLWMLCEKVIGLCWMNSIWLHLMFWKR
jgi:MoxR-like ATPase